MQYKYAKSSKPAPFNDYRNGAVIVTKPSNVPTEPHNRKYKPPVMNKATYQEYLKTENWQKKRTTKLAEECYCQVCGETQSLDVHHLKYRNWYDVKQEDLIVLCHRCHFLAHDLIKQSEGTEEAVYLNNESKSRRRRLIKYTQIEIGIWVAPKKKNTPAAKRIRAFNREYRHVSLSRR